MWPVLRILRGRSRHPAPFRFGFSLSRSILRVGDSAEFLQFAIFIERRGYREPFAGRLASIRRVDATLSALGLCELRWEIARAPEHTGLTQCRRSQSPFTTQTTIGYISLFHDGSIRLFLRFATMAGSMCASPI